MLLYKIAVREFMFLLRAAPGVFRLQGELCQFLFFLSDKTRFYTKFQISVWKFLFLLRAATGVFRLQAELCQFLFFFVR